MSCTLCLLYAYNILMVKSFSRGYTLGSFPVHRCWLNNNNISVCLFISLYYLSVFLSQLYSLSVSLCSLFLPMQAWQLSLSSCKFLLQLSERDQHTQSGQAEQSERPFVNILPLLPPPPILTYSGLYKTKKESRNFDKRAS